MLLILSCFLLFSTIVSTEPATSEGRKASDPATIQSPYNTTLVSIAYNPNVTNYSEISATGDVVFVGSAGLAYGEIYVADNSTTTDLAFNAAERAIELSSLGEVENFGLPLSSSEDFDPFPIVKMQEVELTRILSLY